MLIFGARALLLCSVIAGRSLLLIGGVLRRSLPGSAPATFTLLKARRLRRNAARMEAARCSHAGLPLLFCACAGRQLCRCSPQFCSCRSTSGAVLPASFGSPDRARQPPGRVLRRSSSDRQGQITTQPPPALQPPRPSPAMPPMVCPTPTPGADATPHAAGSPALLGHLHPRRRLSPAGIADHGGAGRPSSSWCVRRACGSVSWDSPSVARRTKRVTVVSDPAVETVRRFPRCPGVPGWHTPDRLRPPGFG